ncbi:MAG: hypothetical protein AB7V77_05945 [Candidatus Woesearchaeota archaeon]
MLDSNELLDLFPFELDNLKIFVKENKTTEKRLKAVYYQENTFDGKRNWDDYEQYLRDIKSAENKGKISKVKLPETIDSIYNLEYKLIEDGKLSKTDKLILSLNSLQENDFVIYVAYIKRNFDLNLKGLGREVYFNLRNAFAEKGLKYFSCIPVEEKLKKEWAEWGMQSARNLSEKKQKELEKIGISFMHYFEKIKESL